jgi:hypothetical protein
VASDETICSKDSTIEMAEVRQARCVGIGNISAMAMLEVGFFILVCCRTAAADAV